MARYRDVISSPRTADEAFAYMARFSNVSEWDPTVAAAQQLTDGEPALGTRFRVVIRWLGREIELEYEITEFEPPRRLVLRAENGTSVSEDTVEVVARGRGSDVTYDARIDLKGVGRLFDPLLGLAFKRLGDNAAAGLRRELGTVAA
jgi:carbon monoxide dehydrogenase subunit G